MGTAAASAQHAPARRGLASPSGADGGGAPFLCSAVARRPYLAISMCPVPMPATDPAHAGGPGRRREGKQDMKLYRERFLAAAMIVAALGAAGCRSHKNDSGDDKASNPAPAPAGTEGASGPAPTAPGEAPAPAPPAPQQENAGTPPSADHFWINGHWHWAGRRYEWVPGHWGIGVA